MSLYRRKYNPVPNTSLVPTATIVTFKSGVANAAALPLSGNILNDGRITSDTNNLYVWDGTTWVNQGDLYDLTWAALQDKPSSSVANIDDAVNKRHTAHSDDQDLSGKVDKVSGSSLVSDTEIAKIHAASGQFNQTVDGEIVGLTDKTIPLDADVTLIESDTDTNAKRKLSWLNIKSTLKTYFDTLYTIVNLGGVAVISTNTTLTVKASGGDFTTIQAALDSLKSKRINSDVTVTISVDPGLFTHTATILFRHPQGNRINLVGAAPVTTTLTSLVSFSGTTGNYSVTLNVGNTTGMAIGNYCIIRGSIGTGEHRAVMGCWEITNIISGTQIVVKNTYRKTIAPTLTITGGQLHCLKTILKFNGCDGLLPGNATGYIYNLAIVGNGTANTDGINISQRGYNYGNHIIYLGETGASYSLGINGFGRYGVANTSKAEVWMISVAVSNCGSYGVYAYNQAQIAGSGIISSGNVSIGIYATDGAWITAVSSFAIGNATVGFYAFNRAGINAELSEAVGNVYSGFQCLGTSYIYAKTTKSLNNGYHGYSSSYNGMIYAQSSIATGNGAAINYYGYWSSNGGHIRADSTTASGNFSGDYFAEHFSFIKVTSYVGSPTFSPVVDTMGNGGAIIRSVVATALKIADAVKNTPAGNIAATDVQAAINELDTEKQASLGFTPEDVSNKRTSFQITPDDTHYPSEKLTKDSLDGKAPTSHTHAQTNVVDLVDDLKNHMLNIMLNAFRIAQIGSLTIFNMVKGFIDEYEDESGIDLVNSVNQSYNSSDDYYSPYTTEVDVDTKLLLHLDNNVTDSENIPKTVTNNNVLFSSSIKKFGSHSASFNGSTAYLSIPDSDDFDFVNGDFTVEFWIQFNSLPAGRQVFISQRQSSNQLITFFYDNDVNLLYLYTAYPGVNMLMTCGFSPSIDIWYHIAYVRSGNTGYIFIDGISQIVTNPGWITVENLSAPLLVGYGSSDIPYYLNGYLDELRISKGIARWTSNFTPPINAYEVLTENMILKSNTQVATIVPTEMRIVIFEEDVGIITLNTDLKAYISRNNGVTYSQVTLEDEGNYISTAKVLSGIVDISGQPSGTDIKYKIETLNNKNLKIHGTGISWK
jgi:hypothetical protein